MPRASFDDLPSPPSIKKELNKTISVSKKEIEESQEAIEALKEQDMFEETKLYGSLIKTVKF